MICPRCGARMYYEKGLQNRDYTAFSCMGDRYKGGLRSHKPTLLTVPITKNNHNPRGLSRLTLSYLKTPRLHA